MQRRKQTQKDRMKLTAGQAAATARVRARRHRTLTMFGDDAATDISDTSMSCCCRLTLSVMPPSTITASSCRRLSSISIALTVKWLRGKKCASVV